MTAEVPYLSIVIPAYNEEQRLIPTLKKIYQFEKNQPYSLEIIVVDDASTDQTRPLAETFFKNKNNWRLISLEKNIGKGMAVRTGVLGAKGDFVLFSDADLSTPIEEVNRLLAYLKKESHPSYDIAIASRRVKGANIVKHQPFQREFAGRIFSILVRLLTLKGFLDTQCGFKLFTRVAAKNVFSRQTITRFGFDVELLFIAKNRFKYRIIEVPVTWNDSPITRVQVLKDSISMFLDLLRIPLNSFRGLYK